MLANVRSAECANISQKPRSGRLFMQSGFAVLKPTNSTSNYASLPPKNELPDPIHQSSQGVSQFVLISRDAMPQFLGLAVASAIRRRTGAGGCRRSQATESMRSAAMDAADINAGVLFQYNFGKNTFASDRAFEELRGARVPIR